MTEEYIQHQIDKLTEDVYFAFYDHVFYSCTCYRDAFRDTYDFFTLLVKEFKNIELQTSVTQDMYIYVEKVINKISKQLKRYGCHIYSPVRRLIQDLTRILTIFIKEHTEFHTVEEFIKIVGRCLHDSKMFSDKSKQYSQLFILELDAYINERYPYEEFIRIIWTGNTCLLLKRLMHKKRLLALSLVADYNEIRVYVANIVDGIMSMKSTLKCKLIDDICIFLSNFSHKYESAINMIRLNSMYIRDTVSEKYILPGRIILYNIISFVFIDSDRWKSLLVDKQDIDKFFDLIVLMFITKYYYNGDSFDYMMQMCSLISKDVSYLSHILFYIEDMLDHCTDTLKIELKDFLLRLDEPFLLEYEYAVYFGVGKCSPFK